MKMVENEIKERLLKQIAEIESEATLLEIEDILTNLYSSDREFVLTPEMLESVKKSWEDIDAGRTIPHRQVMDGNNIN